jgi:hypothetical protein
VLNHDSTPGTLEHVLEELEREAAKAVPMGDHNFLDRAAQGPVQNGEQAWALPVEA